MGGVGDFYGNALAETIDVLYKAELLFHCALCQRHEAVELATLVRVAWFGHHRLLDPIGHVPPAQAEADHCRRLASQAMPAQLAPTGLRESRSGSGSKHESTSDRFRVVVDRQDRIGAFDDQSVDTVLMATAEDDRSTR